jgi:hypothetical protein
MAMISLRYRYASMVGDVPCAAAPRDPEWLRPHVVREVTDEEE